MPRLLHHISARYLLQKKCHIFRSVLREKGLKFNLYNPLETLIEGFLSSVIA